MGSHTLRPENFEGVTLLNNSRILVVASNAFAHPLSEKTEGKYPGMRVAALESQSAIPEDFLANADLLVIEIDPSDVGSMRRIGYIRERWPNLPVVAALENTNVSLVKTLVRQGVSDVVALPFDLDELLQVALETSASNQGVASQNNTLAPMIAVIRSLGGCGATSIATHLAADLAIHDGSTNGVVIADLDLQFGSVADYLGLRPRATISDLLGADDRLDDELLRSVASDAGDNLSVIAAPDSIMPLESVDTDDMLRVIRLLRRRFGCVVLDLPANWTNWTLSTVLTADSIVLVVELTIASLRQAQRRLDLLRSVGVDDRTIDIVVNQFEKRLFRTIDLEDVAKTLGHPVLATVSLESPGLGAAQNQGLLAGKVHRKSKFAADIAHLGELLRSRRLAGGR